MKAILIIILLFSIVLHELGHIVHYWFNGVKIKCVALGCLLVVCDDGIRIGRAKKTSRFYVVPEVPKTYLLEDFEMIIKNNLLAGPISTCLVLLFVIAVAIFNYNQWSYDILFRILIIGNIIINGAILSGCLKNTEEQKGDISFFLEVKNNIHLIDLYVWDYAVYSKRIMRDMLEYKLVFSELSEIEKEDYAFDIVTLFLLGKIENVPNEIANYVQDKYDSMDKNIENSILRNYATFLYRRKKENVIPQIVGNKTELDDDIYDMLHIDEIITERILGYEQCFRS